MTRPAIVLSIVAFSVLLLARQASAAGGLAVSPVSLEFSPQDASRTLEISNPGDDVVHVQLRLFAWSGSGVDEVYTPSQDIGFSPPMFDVQPGKKQVIRLVAKTQPSREAAYRLFVDQILPDGPARGVSMPVRMVLPLFVAPAHLEPPRVSWSLARDALGGLLVARNAGGRRLKVAELQIVALDQTHPVARGLAGYVLAGGERAWRLPLQPNRGDAVTVRAITDVGPLDADVAPE